MNAEGLFANTINYFNELIGGENLAKGQEIATVAMGWLGQPEHLYQLGGICLVLLALRLAAEVIPVMAAFGFAAVVVANPDFAMLTAETAGQKIGQWWPAIAIGLVIAGGAISLLVRRPLCRRPTGKAMDSEQKLWIDHGNGVSREQAVEMRVAELKAEAQKAEIEAAARERFEQLRREEAEAGLAKEAAAEVQAA